MYLASWDLKKTLSGRISTLREPPRDPPDRAPIFSGSPRGAQDGPRGHPGRPRTPQDPPKALLEHPCEFQLGNFFLENRQLTDFTQIYLVFYQFSLTIIPLQIDTCQLLHIFPCDFNNFTNSTPLPPPPRTPSGTLLDPPRTLQNPLGDRFLPKKIGINC